MGLLTKPAALTSISRALYSWLNSRVDDLYNIIGTTLNGRGSLNYLNLSATADLAPSQGRGTFATLTDPDALGTQIITRATQFTNMSGDGLDVSTSNRADIAVSNGATTLAIASPNERFQRLVQPNTVSADASITTITGGTSGRIYTFLWENEDAASTIYLLHTAANTANSFKMKFYSDSGTSARVFDKQAGVSGGQARGSFGSFVFGDLNGSGVSQFWEI